MENADCMVERLHLQSAFARSQANAHRTVCLTARRLRELWRLTPYMRPTVPETPHGVSLATGAHRAPAKRSARVGRRASRALRPTRLRPCKNGPLRGLNTAFAIPSALRPQPRLQTVHRTVCLTARRLRELWRLTPYMRPTVPETPHGVSLATGAHRAPAKRSARVGRRASRALRPTRLRPCKNGPLRGLNTAFAIPSALRPQPRLQTVHRTVCLTARRLRELWRLTPKLPSDPMPGAWWRVLPGRPGIPPEAWPSERQPRRRIR